MPARSPMRQSKKQAFLAAYAELGTIRAAAVAAGIDRHTHGRWMVDPDYAERFAQAREDAADMLEEVALQRARGFDVVMRDEHGQVVHDEAGEPVVVRRGSDTLLIFTLKALRPEKYRENARVEFAGSVAVTTSSDLDAELRGFFAGVAAVTAGAEVPDPVE